MTDQVDVPKVGPVNKKVMLGVGGAAAAYVGYRYYVSRKDAAAAASADTTATDPSFQDPGAIPSVTGAVSPTNDYGYYDGTTPSTSSYGFTGTTNSEWTQYAQTQLSQSESWSYTDIVTALGNFIGNKSLTTLQQQIVQAAIALAGYPPQGSHVVIPGGDATISVAPSGLHGSALSSASVSLNWSPVAGAAGYHIYRTGVAQIVGESTTTSGQVGGLSAGTKYTFQVAAHTGSGQTGPKSGSVSVTTKTASLKAPAKPIITHNGNTGCKVVWKAVAGATSYHVFRNGASVGTTAGTWLSQTGLKHNTSYTWQVQAAGAGGAVSAKSQSASARTKK